MKKLVVCLLVLCLAFALCACTDKKSQKEPQNQRTVDSVTETAPATAVTQEATQTTATDEEADEPVTGEAETSGEVSTQENEAPQDEDIAPEEDN